MSRPSFLFLLPLLLTGACVSITHPAKVTPGWSTHVLGAYDRVDRDTPDRGVQTDATGHVQLAFGYGRHVGDGDDQVYGGVALGVMAGGGLGALPYAAADLYYQFLGEDAPVDAGVGVIVGYLPGVYGLVGKQLAPSLRVDGGVKVSFQLDGVRGNQTEDTGPLAEITPQLLVTLGHHGATRLSFFGEWSAYRKIDHSPFGLPDEEGDAMSALVGNLTLGLVACFGM